MLLLWDAILILWWIHYFHLTIVPLSIVYVIPESKLIYLSLPGVMGHLQVIMLAEWYFIAPGAAVNQKLSQVQNMLCGNSFQWGPERIIWDQFTPKNVSNLISLILLSKSVLCNCIIIPDWPIWPDAVVLKHGSIMIGCWDLHVWIWKVHQLLSSSATILPPCLYKP